MIKAAVIHSSSVSHRDLWWPIRLIGPRRSDGFIFSTDKNDSAPFAIVEISYDNKVSSVTKSEIIIDIYNRYLGSSALRALGLKISSSEDRRDWRAHDVTADRSFLLDHQPISIKLFEGERYIMFSRDGTGEHFHLGDICLNPTDSHYNSYVYDISFLKFALRYGRLSNSQLFQDLFAVYNCGFAPNYFLEFGVNDGISLSNTILLEHLGWHGIAGEAIKELADKARKIRHCIVVEGALGKDEGTEVEFYSAGLLSSSTNYGAQDHHAKARTESKKVKARTLRIDKLLDQFNALSNIGFLTLDVEGAEVEILEIFPFRNYSLTCAVVEHNFTLNEHLVDDIFASNNFSRVLKDFSSHDAFYVRNDAILPDWRHIDLLEDTKNKCIDANFRRIQKIMSGSPSKGV